MANSSSFDLSDAFGTSAKAEVEGVWVGLGGEAGIKVARLGNPEAQKAYRKIPRNLRRQIEDTTLGDNESVKFLANFLSENILKDWKGLSDGGKNLPTYSASEGAKMLRKLRRFRDRVWEVSMDEDLFNVEEEEDRKNSPKRSAGT